jgi:hypothetical protein
MNYCVSLKVKIEGNRNLQLGDGHVLPWEYQDLIEASSGWIFVNGEDLGLAETFITKLEKGIIELSQHREDYQRYEVRHGMGTINEALIFYRNLLKDCREYPFADVFGSVV